MATDLVRARHDERPGHAFRAERAISPVDGAQWWVVIDAQFVVHPEASGFLRCLHGASLSPNTVRVYAGRVAAFLSWCGSEGVDWRTVSLSDLARFKHFLEVSPIGRDRYRTGSTVNAVLTAVYSLSGTCAPDIVISIALLEYVGAVGHAITHSSRKALPGVKLRVGAGAGGWGAGLVGGACTTPIVV